jgi:hypothetical protein
MYKPDAKLASEIGRVNKPLMFIYMPDFRGRFAIKLACSREQFGF